MEVLAPLRDQARAKGSKIGELLRSEVVDKEMARIFFASYSVLLPSSIVMGIFTSIGLGSSHVLSPSGWTNRFEVRTHSKFIRLYVRYVLIGFLYLVQTSPRKLSRSKAERGRNGGIQEGLPLFWKLCGSA